MAIVIGIDDIKRRLQLPAGSVNCVMANAGDLITSVLHGLAVGDVIAFGTTAYGVTAGTLYWVRTITSPDVFEISATRGGALFAITGDGANTYSQKTVYDADITALITEMQASLTGMVDTTAISTYEAACKGGMIDVIAGETLNMLRRQPGFAEAVTAGGIALGAAPESGDKLVERGMAILGPFLVGAYDELLVKKAEAAFAVLLAAARDDDTAAQADAELAKMVNDAALVASQKAKVDADELLIDKQALTEAAMPAKVAADTAMSTGLAADAQARAAAAIARTARIAAEDAAIAGVTDVPLESHVAADDVLLDVSSLEYD